MARSSDEIEREIRQATTLGFRNKLLARGQARSFLWRDGELPAGSARFSPLLSYDLLSYGYGLLSYGLRLREIDGDRGVACQAFEFAADSIGSVVTNGVDHPDRDFHRFIAAASYHLGGFAARAYSLLQAGSDGPNLSPIEMCISRLMLRDLNELEEQITERHDGEEGSDLDLVKALDDLLGGGENEVINSRAFPSLSDELITLVDLAITDHFLRSISMSTLAMEHGNPELLKDSIDRLRVGLNASGELNMMPQWWCHRLAIHLIDDIWTSSFHHRLPHTLNGSESADWSTLRAIFIAALIRRSRAEIELWPSQLDASDRAINRADSLVIALPTSAGKTRIAELCILKCLANQKRVVYVTPLRALSAQVEVGLRRTFGPLGKTVSSLYGSIGTSESDGEIIRSQDIIVATPEKLDFALRNEPNLLNDVGLIVLDEGHMIGLEEREVRYEVQIQRLLKRVDADQRRIVCLSAIFPEGEELDDFVGWITHDSTDGLVKENWRPTVLRYGEVLWKGQHGRLNINIGGEISYIPQFITASVPSKGKRQREFPGDQRELCLATAWRLVEDGQTVLIFCPQKRSVAPFAKSIADLHERGVLESLFEVGQDVLGDALTIGTEWFGQDHVLLKCLRLGVAIHHGALPTPYRKEVERLLRKGVLKVTISSPTLSQGLNLSATVLVMHSLYRSGSIIDNSEFKNIKGRAGRAYIDLSGLVVFPIYDQGAQRKMCTIWRNLIRNDMGRSIKSGLFQLLSKLIVRMAKKINQDSPRALIAYIANNAQAWDFPKIQNENDHDCEVEKDYWYRNITYLDTAVLALLGEHEVADEEIEKVIDTVMRSSLFERTLARIDEDRSFVIRFGLMARARYIWSQTTPAQRRGYFLAGISLETGRELDAHASVLNRLLVDANAAIISSDSGQAIETIIEFAKIVFTIPPFRPDNPPPTWDMVLDTWLRGGKIATVIQDNQDQVLQFIERALVYQLVWAMEAVRIRGVVNNDPVGEDGAKMSDLEFSYAVIAVETGTIDQTASLLIRLGFGSRMAAIKIAQSDINFASSHSLQRWLSSKEGKVFSRDPNWPTPATHDLWTSFVGHLVSHKQADWDICDYYADVVWDGQNLPSSNNVLRIATKADGGSVVLDAQCNRIGILKRKLNPNRKGLLLANATDTINKIQTKYLGPDDLFVD